MSETSTESSPLKLYQKAYVLHHKEHKLAQACEIYERLIKEFPDADVSAYASVQLQKIHASEVTGKIARQRGPGLPTILLLIVNVLLLCAVGLLFGMHVYQLDAERVKHGALAQALAKMYSGQEEEALDILRELKISFRNDITPFVISSEIYRRHNDYLRARKEYETYRRLYPDDPVPVKEIAKLNKEEDAYIKGMMQESGPKKTIPEELTKEQDRKAAARAGSGRTRKKRVPKKTRMLVPVDSISYF
ncbi:MAG: tetratricopeptide repeat protein [Chitinivibrionales bacterium]|nr:tetratricopeptide repeat protein [Chitinivibrionales bacterium]MBD3396588.1 tetratricopeptide repeat protein [Chitinivibrionales bacterium]